MESQCSLMRWSVTWSCFFPPRIIFAAEFWTSCNLFICVNGRPPRRLLFWSRRGVTYAWMMVCFCSFVKYWLILLMVSRWNQAVWHVWVTWPSILAFASKIAPMFRTWFDLRIWCSPTVMEWVLILERFGFDPSTINSVLSSFSFSQLIAIQFLIASIQRSSLHSALFSVSCFFLCFFVLNFEATPSGLNVT